MLTKAVSTRQRAGTLLLCIIVMLAMLMPQANSAFAEEGQSQPTYYDGTYEGSGRGYSDSEPIKVKVTVSEGKISGIEVVSHDETASYWKRIDLDAFFGAMIEKQSTDVDTVSGATVSCEGLQKAVANALEAASIDPEGFYSSGNGTQAKPYVIETAAQLQKFAALVDSGEGLAEDGLAGKYVELGKDIDLSGIENWNPIGTEGESKTAKKFAGTFNGKGHTISGMKIHKDGLTAETNAGLFATLDTTAVVKDLHMTGVDIDLKGSGVLRAGSIAADTVNGKSGTEGTSIDRCSATGSVKAESSGQALVFSAGLVGRAMTWVKASNCWTDVDTSAISRGGSHSGYAGGIFGMSGNNSLVVNSAVFGDSYGCSPKSTNFGGMAGGLGGMLTCKAWNIYAMGDAKIGNGGTVHKWVGAIAGEFPSGGMVKDGANYTYPETGAFRDFGYYADDISLKIEKWNASGSEVEETTDTDLRAAGTSTTMNTHDKVFDTSENVKAMKREDMAKQEFADTLGGNLKEVRKLLDVYGYTDVNIYNWKAEDGKVLPTGEKWVNTEPEAALFESGTGSADDPFIIKTKEQLKAFAGSLTEGIDYEGFIVKLGDDIDISDMKWEPIGGQEFAFNGTFDGAGKTVSGMNAGTAEEPYKMTSDNPYMGFFGVLGKDAVVKDLTLDNVSITADMDPGRFLGGIAAINDANSQTRAGTTIDGCVVKGELTAVSTEGNTFVGGVMAYQNRGAIINTSTDMKVSCTVRKGNATAESGGLVGLNNRGLVANCYTLGDVYGSASRNNGDEGMASTGNLVGVQAGDLVGCYSMGNNETGEYSVYAGEIAGWITGIGKAYSCYYNKEAEMTIDGRKVVPPADFGTKVAPGVNEEGDEYVGGLVDKLTGFTAADFEGIAEKMNAAFDKYPVDISKYGLGGKALRKWKYDGNAKLVVFDDEKAETKYEQPACEIVVPEAEEMRNGTWTGRSEDGEAIVRILVKSNKIRKTEVLKGEESGAAYEAALAKAEEKAIYGDTTGYGKADGKLFARGSGTKDDPYRISNEKQLRAIAESLNEDEAFEGVYFRQTNDIDVSGEEWLPIGHAIRAKINKKWSTYAAYPFLGSYDGAGYSITGLTIGSENTPSDDPRVQFTAGMFGFISGDHNTNAAIAEGERISELRDINLENVCINVSSTDQNYVAGLVANAQNGFEINGCSVTGSVSSQSANSFARAGGLSANVLRGTVLNCMTDVKVFAETDAGNAYAGGMHAMDNRTGTLNSYALGDVTANAAANNKVHVGGFTGQFGGLHFNCYAAGDVTSLKTTTDAGLVNGRFAGIAASANVYYSSDAQLTVAGSAMDPAANGVVVSTVDEGAVGEEAKTASELRTGAFADLLTENELTVTDKLADLSAKISGQTDLMHTVLFSGTADDLLAWEADGIVGLAASPLREAKVLAAAEIRDMFEGVSVDPALEEVLQAALDEAIDSAESASDADAAAAAATAAEEKLRTIVDQSKRLQTVKQMARNELLTKKLSDYSDQRREQVIDILVEAQEKINNAKDQDEVEAILKEASDQIAGIKTDGAIEAEKKAAAKKAADKKKAAAAVKAKTKIKAKAKKGRKATITWKKVKGVTGYEVYRAAKKKGKYAKIATVKGWKTAKYVNKKLRAKKNYFYKVRPYTRVSGKKISGKWSNIAKVKARR